MSGEQNWEWNQNDALKAAGTITDLRIKLSQAEQLRDQYRGDLTLVNKALDGHAREIIRLTAALETCNDSRLELLQLAESYKAKVAEARIEVLEQAMERMKAHLGLLHNAEVRYAYELLRDRRDALKKETE